jgi:hypothetical protein
LREVGPNFGDAHAQADLPRIGAAAVFGRGRAKALRLKELRSEDRFGLLEAHGLRVGQIVADDIDLCLGSLHASQGGDECGG